MKKSELIQLIKECHHEILMEQLNKSPIHLWVYWGYNYPSDFIEKIWKGNDHMIKHLTNKFKQIYNRHGPSGVMNKFYVELDNTNREILENWVLTNYKG